MGLVLTCIFHEPITGRQLEVQVLMQPTENALRSDHRWSLKKHMRMHHNARYELMLSYPLPIITSLNSFLSSKLIIFSFKIT